MRVKVKTKLFKILSATTEKIVNSVKRKRIILEKILSKNKNLSLGFEFVCERKKIRSVEFLTH